MQNELQHFGILGMRWGVRRTPEQLGHSPVNEAKARSAVDQIRRNDLKNRRLLSSAEIREKIDRLKLEKELRELTDNEVNAGQNYFKEIVKEGGKKTLSTAFSGVSLYALKALTAKKFDKNELADAIFYGGAKKK